jgi:hypothetical protein
MKNLFKEEAWSFWAPVIFAALVAVFYARILFGGGVFAFIDASRFFYPFWKWGSLVWAQGLIPLWNSDVQFGTPYFADPQMAAAYPPVFLFYSFLKPTDAFVWLVMLHHYWALLGFWVLARQERFTVPAAFLGSLVFGFSLHVVCSSWTPVALFAISWVPWIFWAAQRLWENWAGAWIWLALFLGLQMAAGYPVLSYLTGLGLTAHLLWKSFWPWPQRLNWRPFRWIPAFGGAAALALLYNLVWFLPFLELKGLSNYAPGAALAHPLIFSDFATWISPFFRGNPAQSDYQGPYWVGFYFMGLPVAALLVWGFWKGVFLRTSPWLFVIFLVLSLGETLYLGSFLKSWLPGYSLVIRSGFWLSLVVLFAARLAMEASENFFRKEFRKGPLLVSWIAVWITIYLLSFILKRPVGIWPFVLSLALGILAARPGWFTPRWRWFFLIASLLASLGPAASGVNILMNRSFYDQPPPWVSAMNQSGRLFDSPLLFEGSKRLNGSSLTEAYEDVKQEGIPNWPLAFGKEEAEVYNSLYMAAPDNWVWTSLRFSPRQSRLVMDYLGIRYLVGSNDFKDLKPIRGMDPSLKFFENPSAFPKWFSVRRAAASSDLTADFQKTSDPRWNYGTDCFVNDPSAAGLYTPRRVAEITRSSQALELVAQGSGEALLASSETAYPGWRARVEGHPRPLEVVNHVFRGLLLKDGETRVLLSYEPASFRLGLFAALLAAATFAMGWMGRRFS